MSVSAPTEDKFYISKSPQTGHWQLRRGVRLISLYLSWAQAIKGVRAILDAEKRFGGDL